MIYDMMPINDIIERLRKEQKKQKLSYSKIRKMIEENGDYPPSISTLSRLFSEDSITERFRYEDTIRPIVKVMLNIDSIEEDDTDDVKTLKALLAVKKKRIEELEAELDKISIKNNEKLEKERHRFNKSIDFLKEQLAYKDKRMDLLLESVQKKDELHEKMLEKLLMCSACKMLETDKK